MDKQIKIAYDRGIRAYYRDGEPEFIDQRFPDANYVWSSLGNWIALRAYQDEQRKKGEPIGRIEGWKGKSHVSQNEEGKPCEFNFIHVDHHPVIFVGHRAEIGIFTNFRWRPGHGPKGMSPTFVSETSYKKCRETCLGTSVCDMTGCRKGGTNG